VTQTMPYMFLKLRASTEALAYHLQLRLRPTAQINNPSQHPKLTIQFTTQVKESSAQLKVAP
jgi:hypothetical protein